ncbi:MAG TPA: hypothetical protein VG759_07265 [Candidatus Angelobacter sp.]|nr:hypothetical protein [Candidatus Angelobacter sp.]
MPQSFLERLLNYKPSAAFYIIGILAIFFAMVVITRYRATGRVNLGAMINRGTETTPFWKRNPNLELVDSYPHTSLVMVRDRATGRTAMLDLAVGLTAQLRTVSCDDSGGFRSELINAGAEEIVCFTIDKPDTGAGTLFTSGVSFRAKDKDSQVEHFYRSLLTSQGKRVTVVQSSSQAIIMEAENENRDTVARISIRGEFDTARGFLAWTKDFR